MTRYIAGLGIAAAILVGATTANAQEDAAQAAAESWLKIVDHGAYERSWDEASQAFKAALPKEKWAESRPER